MSDEKSPLPQRKPVESASAAPGEKRSASRAKASESGDPAVHKALADRYTAQQNEAYHRNAAEQAAAAQKGNAEEVAAADKALEELGFE
jgi:hypothetical protein